MATRLTVDTSFLIDVQRERASSSGDGPAHAFLRGNPDALLVISAVALGEFSEGFDRPDHPLIGLVRSTHEVLGIDDEVARIYGMTARRLRSKGMLIGSNDLWIAATALRHDLPVVTANERQFRRVERLDVRSYR